MDASSLLSPPSGDGDEPVCYLCLDTGADEPLRRDCACRGTDAGFVHLSCLAEYAATISQRADELSLGMIEFVKPWGSCPVCHQYYQNKLAVDIASEFVSFVRRQYPNDTQSQVEALYLKLVALIDILDRLHPLQKKEAGVTATVILSLIDRMKKEDASPLSMRYYDFESYAYSSHGRIALKEGTEESARRAVAHFEKDLKVCKAIGDAEGIATAKANIAVAKSKYEGGNNEQLLKASQEVYELRVAELGEENEYTILAGVKYARDLRRGCLGGDARELLTMLLTTSKRVLGPHHNTTKKVESEARRVW
jgi:hypothetical protein